MKNTKGVPDAVIGLIVFVILIIVGWHWMDPFVSSVTKSIEFSNLPESEKSRILAREEQDRINAFYKKKRADYDEQQKVAAATRELKKQERLLAKKKAIEEAALKKKE